MKFLDNEKHYNGIHQIIGFRSTFPSLISKIFGFVKVTKISQPKNAIKEQILDSEILNQVEYFDCKKCKAHHKYIIKEKVIFKDVKQIYYECSNCKDYTPVFRINSVVEKLQLKSERMLSNILITLKTNKKETTQRLIKDWQTSHLQKLRLIKSLSKY